MTHRLSRTTGLLSCLLLFASLPALAQTRYIAFGDSITEGVGDDVPEGPDAGYPIRLQNLIAPDVVENRGKSGDDTTEALTRLPGVLLDGGDVMLLMFGTNDVAQQIAPEDTVFNLRQMARSASNQGMQVIHATVIPRLPNARHDPMNHVTKELVQEIRNAAGFDGRRLVDPFEKFLSLDRLFAEYYWQTTDPRDPVGHPNARGYDEMAQAFADVIQGNDTLPPVNGTTDPTDGLYRVPNQQSIRVDVWDLESGIDLDATRLLVNGQEVAVEVQGDNRFATLTHSPARLQGPISVRLQTQDRASPPNTFDREISKFFTRGTNFPDADFDRNGRVDGLDLIALARAFASTGLDARYFFPADLNQDGVIDGVDLAAFADSFGRRAN